MTHIISNNLLEIAHQVNFTFINNQLYDLAQLEEKVLTSSFYQCQPTFGRKHGTLVHPLVCEQGVLFPA